MNDLILIFDEECLINEEQKDLEIVYSSEYNKDQESYNDETVKDETIDDWIDLK